MKIAIAASEVTPFAKTGGLADVIGSLPKALAKSGCEVKVFMPKYSSIDEYKYELHYESALGEIPIRVGGNLRNIHVLTSKLPGSDVEVYFIDCPQYFNRNGFYTNDPDEPERFILFCKSVIEVLQKLKWFPDVIHCNDWQTGLIPAYLKDNYSWDMAFDKTTTLLSIHNIAYQGRFFPETRFKAETKPEWYYPEGPYEFHGTFSFMKAGISFSDIISTVSETYAGEILTNEYGEGLEDVLRSRKNDLFGILNGIDDDIWDPETDRFVRYNYGIKNIEDKEKNKEFLLNNTPLHYIKGKPLIGIISRLVDQKGFDLFAQVFNDLLTLDAQWVILGSGDERYEYMISNMERFAPDKVWTYIGFSNELAHQIEAGADIFLMPSRFEPCGLNQMYSLRYGTIPIVRKTGGLADTVKDWDEYKWDKKSEEGNGFSFNDATGYAMLQTIWRALHTYYNDQVVWRKMQKNGMLQNFSWDASAKKYIMLYNKAINHKTNI
jgi:starch synthase